MRVNRRNVVRYELFKRFLNARTDKDTEALDQIRASVTDENLAHMCEKFCRSFERELRKRRGSRGE